MRIATPMIQNSVLSGLRARLQSLAAAHEESATGRRIRTVSDDPGDASRLMRLGSQLRDIAQYRRNMTSARIRLSAEDAVLETTKDVMRRAKDLAVSAATPSPTDPMRIEALAEARTLREQLIALGNTRIGNEYIFGGGKVDTPAFLADGTYAGDFTVRQTTIDDGIQAEMNHTGNQVLSSAIQAVLALEQELEFGTPQTIQASQAALESANQGVLAGQTQVGSWLRGMEYTTDHLARRENVFEDQREALRDADPTESALKLINAQSALERAYAVAGRVLSTNLLQYLA